MDIEDVRQRNTSMLMRLPNVVGVFTGEKAGSPAIVVMVTHKVPETSLQPQEIVPKTIDGYSTDVMEVASVNIQASSAQKQGKAKE